MLAVVLGGEEELNTSNRREVRSMGLGGVGLKGEENSRKGPPVWFLCLLGYQRDFFYSDGRYQMGGGVREDK